MISHVCGKLKRKKEDRLFIDVQGLVYEILVPVAVMKAIEQDPLKEGDAIELITYHYLQVEPSRGIPVLIGFLKEIEREFFEKFITVSGVGPRAACRALSLPISIIARAIDEGDQSVLESLPGIGIQRAKEIIAKLQGKVGKFGLIQDQEMPQGVRSLDGDVSSEALEVLLQLQYKRQEAMAMIQEALARQPKPKSAEDLLNEVYRQRTVGKK
ncbi:MAG: hypothetical protein HY590_05315 [Candidatus Omnitrophica bacterium]|nr:hypothetical protein [Candidatus Omnitrophota bacterium]